MISIKTQLEELIHNCGVLIEGRDRAAAGWAEGSARLAAVEMRRAAPGNDEVTRKTLDRASYVGVHMVARARKKAAEAVKDLAEFNDLAEGYLCKMVTVTAARCAAALETALAAFASSLDSTGELPPVSDDEET